MVKLYKLVNDNFEKEESNDLAEVVIFDDGQCVVKWCGEIRSLVIFKSFDEFKSLSVTGTRRLEGPSLNLI